MGAILRKMSIPDPATFSMLNAFLGGRSMSDIAQDYGISASAVSQRLNHPQIKPEVIKRLNTLANRALEFKLDAFDGAEVALKKLIKLSDGAKTEELQRLASLDVVKISGLMPRKRLLIESNGVNGIDQDTREWISQVIKEVGSGSIVANNIIDI